MTKKQKSGTGKKEGKLLLATLLLTIGVYLAFPEHGLVATFPLLFIFAFVSGLIYRVMWFYPVAGGGIALLYGVMASFPAAVFFGLFSAVTSFLGAFCARALLRAPLEKKGKTTACFLLPFLVAMVLPMLFAGSPVSYLREREEALSYLKQNYPDQAFSQVVFYYDLSSRNYRATVSYDNEGNTLSSELIFGTTVEDGYRKAYSDYVLIRHKSELIGAFQENDISAVTEERALLVERSEPVPGTYGTLSEDMLPLTHYAVTFREEKTERREFAEACGEALKVLQENDVRFGMITFYGLDAGNVIYRCDVSFDTAPEETLSLVTSKVN